MHQGRPADGKIFLESGRVSILLLEKCAAPVTCAP